MVLAEEAEAAKRSGDLTRFADLTREALGRESEAAWLVVGDSSLEPSRSVLFRSAATLAIDCHELRTAEQLIAAALAGNPPAEIADELRDLLEDVYFHRHLEIRGVVLSPNEVQMTLEGDAVGFGIARSESFIQRVKDLETLLYRTAERRLGREFREAGRRKKDLAASLELFVSVPRAASFAVTLRLGQSSQMSLPGLDFGADTMRELLDGLSMVNSGDLPGLETSIPDESYRVNFIGLTERLAPDGTEIRTVGFTTVTHDQERVVALVTPKKQMRDRARRLPETGQQTVEVIQVEIRGVLLEANAKSQKRGEIEVVDSAGKPQRIVVPRGMMSDIVKPMFEEEVVVAGVRKGTIVELLSIDLAELEPDAD